MHPRWENSEHYKSPKHSKIIATELSTPQHAWCTYLYNVGGPEVRVIVETITQSTSGKKIQHPCAEGVMLPKGLARFLRDHQPPESREVSSASDSSLLMACSAGKVHSICEISFQVKVNVSRKLKNLSRRVVILALLKYE